MEKLPTNPPTGHTQGAIPEPTTAPTPTVGVGALQRIADGLGVLREWWALAATSPVGHRSAPDAAPSDGA
ncbi:MAG: hypothetical protein IRY92_04230 [Dactylosporangium sp.]|nr:hypothetical protein [Dactylosporangium sp.]